MQLGITLFNYLFFWLQEKWDPHSLERKETCTVRFLFPVLQEIASPQFSCSGTEGCTKGYRAMAAL